MEDQKGPEDHAPNAGQTADRDDWTAELVLSGQSIPTLYCNRFFVAHSGALLRVAFAETFDPQVAPAYRTAVAMHTADMKQLAAVIVDILGRSGQIEEGFSIRFEGGKAVSSEE